jgi:hypothetical protein
MYQLILLPTPPQKKIGHHSTISAYGLIKCDKKDREQTSQYFLLGIKWTQSGSANLQTIIHFFKKRDVMEEEGRLYPIENKAYFTFVYLVSMNNHHKKNNRETSAKNGCNIKELFRKIAESLHPEIPPPPSRMYPSDGNQ